MSCCDVYKVTREKQVQQRSFLDLEHGILEIADPNQPTTLPILLYTLQMDFIVWASDTFAS